MTNTNRQEGKELITNIYFPMSANILTVGHIRCLEYLTQYGFVTVGLLTAKAMKGYKKEIVPYEDRRYILDTIAQALEDILVVPQTSLNPAKNVKHFHCTHMASGDGFIPIEQKCIQRYNLGQIDVRLKGEKTKRYSSSRIYENSLDTGSVRDSERRSLPSPSGLQKARRLPRSRAQH